MTFRPGAAWQPAALAGSVLTSVLLTFASIMVFAAAFYLLAPFFDTPRVWRRSVALAAFSATPVLLAGALLVLPAMIVASVATLIHCFARSHLGAAAGMLAVVGGLLLGGLCSAGGLI